VLWPADRLEVLSGRVDDAQGKSETIGGGLQAGASLLAGAEEVLNVQQQDIEAEALHQCSGEKAVQTSGRSGDGPDLSSLRPRIDYIGVTGVLHKAFTSPRNDSTVL
jgi:hypothetical protein